jgi:hypothetical protein
MGRQRHTAEEIVGKLREAEGLLSKRMSMEEALQREETTQLIGILATGTRS